MNKKGEVKLVDFGVSGQLEKSLAKTNIGCQSYMAVSLLALCGHQDISLISCFSPNELRVNPKTNLQHIQYHPMSGQSVYQ